METLQRALPEIYLFLTILGLIVGESAYYKEKFRLILPTCLVGIAGAMLQTLLAYRGDPGQVFAGTISIDGFSLFFKFLFLILAAAGVTAACLSNEIPRRSRAEFCALVLLGTIALMVAASATQLFVITIALQVAGASAYFLAGFGRPGHASSEAALKLMFSLLAAGAFFLVGSVALFLLAGTANIYELHHVLQPGVVQPVTALLVFATLFLGLSLPMMVFPSQFWLPDVLQGACSPAGAFLVLGLRAGAFAVAVRLWVVAFSAAGSVAGRWLPSGGWDWTSWLAVSAALTLITAALLATRQTHAKRLLACVATVQSGFLLMGLLVLEEIGLAAVLFTLLVDLLAFAGLMFVLSLGVERSGSDEISRLRGCMRGRPWEAVAFILFLVSWLGLPPFAGGIARFSLFGAAVRREWYLLAFLGLAAFVLIAVSSGRLALSVLATAEKQDDQSESTVVPEWGQRVFFLALTIPLAAATVFAEWLLRWAGHSLKFIFW